MQVLHIPKFDKRHANGELRKKDGEWFWVRIPTTMDSLTRQRLMQTSEGRNAYCVYMHLAAIAAKDSPRGVLGDERGPFTFADLSLKTAIPQGVIESAVQVLCDRSIGWLEYREWNGNEITTRAGHSNSISCSNSSGGSAEGGGDRFDEFWDAYPADCPRKVGKALCKRLWVRNGLDAIAEQVMAGLERWKASKQWAKDSGEFIPSPKTWLGREDWTAEVKADPARGRKATAAKWDSLGAEKHRELLKAVQDADPDVVHRPANAHTQSAMRKLAKERGWI